MSRHTQLPEFINSENDLSAATDGRGVMHKERGEEKGKSPHSPLKEKGLLPVIREKKRLKPRSSIAQTIDFRR